MTAPRPRVTKAAMSEATTRRLLDVARTLFAAKGFAETGTEEVVTTAGVTRGALYHHFKTKEALFEAVFLELQAEIGARIAAADDPGSDLWTRFLDGCRAFLAACLDPDVRRIVILDGPAVLGPEAWRRADEVYATHQLRECLAALAAEGRLAPVSVDALTAMLNGALNDAALWIALAPDPSQAFQSACQALEALIHGLRR